MPALTRFIKKQLKQAFSTNQNIFHHFMYPDFKKEFFNLFFVFKIRKYVVKRSILILWLFVFSVSIYS